MVKTYTNGREALNALARAQPEWIPDLIFLNIQMPGLDGYDGSSAILMTRMTGIFSRQKKRYILQHASFLSRFND